VDGKSILRNDEQLQDEFKSVPSYEHTLVWVNPTSYPDSIVPGPGGTSLHFVTFPPGSVFADPAFDGEAARSEALSRLRGLADHFEKEDPAMHKTNTVVNLIGSTRTKKGLRAKAKPDKKQYETGRKISDEEMDQLNIKYDKVNPQWNYTIYPRTQKPKAKK
jgi:hypothetical protein